MRGAPCMRALYDPSLVEGSKSRSDFGGGTVVGGPSPEKSFASLSIFRPLHKGGVGFSLLIHRVFSRSRRREIKEDEAEEHCRVAAIGRRKEALAHHGVTKPVADRHFAGGDERGPAAVEA